MPADFIKQVCISLISIPQFSSSLQVLSCIVRAISLRPVAVGAEVLQVIHGASAAPALRNDMVHVHLGGSEFSSTVRTGIPSVIPSDALPGSLPVIAASVHGIIVHIHDFPV